MRFASIVLSLILLPTAAVQAQEARDIPPRPLSEAEDPLNSYVMANTVDGLVLTVTVDGTAISLDQATPARIPNKSRLQLRGEGDFAPVTAVGISAGARISQASVPDSVLRALDDWSGKGTMVRVTRRQITIPLPAPRALDSVEVTAPATGAHAIIDVRAAYAELCRASGGTGDYCPARPR